MDKKTGIILGIISAIVVILVVMVFVMDSKVEPMDKNTILVVEGENYTIDEFQKFAKIINHEESGDITKKMTEEETMSMLDAFLIQKIYLNAAKKHNITLESGDTANFESDFEDDAIAFASGDISKEDFIKYQTETALVQKLQNNIGDYYTLPDDIYNQIKDSFISENLYKTYGFRLMQIPYDAPKSGESGETDILDKDEEEKEDLSRETQLKLAESVLQRIKSGESFEELSKEYGSSRLTFKGSEYTLVNGELEYVTSPLLQSKLNNEKIYNAVLEMNSGDLSQIIEDEEYTSFNIVKLESLEEGFVGQGEEEIKTILLNEYANDIVAQGVKFEMNQSAYIRALYK